MTAIQGKNILLTGASMSIGASIARHAAKHGANLALVSRSEDKLKELKDELKKTSPNSNIHYYTADVQSSDEVYKAVNAAVKDLGQIDVLINNAGLALGAPARLHELKLEDINTMISTNINGYMYTCHAVLNAGGMAERKHGTILNVTSTTGLEVPPFPGEAVYHTSKAAQEAFSNVLRTELKDTSIKVIVLRPGVVATHFHELRVGYDQQEYNDFMAGFEPLVAEDVGEACMLMLSQQERVSVRALDVIPTAQRSLQVIDKNWNERQGVSN